jgi:hypothetical protein
LVVADHSDNMGFFSRASLRCWLARRDADVVTWCCDAFESYTQLRDRR